MEEHGNPHALCLRIYGVDPLLVGMEAFHGGKALEPLEPQRFHGMPHPLGGIGPGGVYPHEADEPVGKSVDRPCDGYLVIQDAAKEDGAFHPMKAYSPWRNTLALRVAFSRKYWVACSSARSCLASSKSFIVLSPVPCIAHRYLHGS